MRYLAHVIYFKSEQLLYVIKNRAVATRSSLTIRVVCPHACDGMVNAQMSGNHQEVNIIVQLSETTQLLQCIGLLGTK